MSTMDTSGKCELFDIEIPNNKQNVVDAALENALLNNSDCNGTFFPTTLDLAIICQHSYDKENGNGNASLPDGFAKIFKCKSNSDGYKGAAFLNKEKKQLVIGHGGTENLKDFYADYLGVWLQRPTPQNNSAYVFSNYVIKKYEGDVLSVSLTGHSLGGWLAQTTALYLKDPEIAKNDNVSEAKDLEVYDVRIDKEVKVLPQAPRDSVHVHVVSFDSPGCRNMLTDRYRNNEKSQAAGEEMIRKLDVTIYLSWPNYVNSYATQIGRIFSFYDLVYMKESELKKRTDKDEGLYQWFKNKFTILKEYKENYNLTKETHAIGTIIEILMILKEFYMFEIVDWGNFLNSSVEFNQCKNRRYEIRKPDFLTIPLAIFDDKEFNFLVTMSILHKVKRHRNIFSKDNEILSKIDPRFLQFNIPLESLGRSKIAFDIHILNECLYRENFVTFWKCWMIRNAFDVQYYQNVSFYVAKYGRPAEYMQLAEMVEVYQIDFRNKLADDLKAFVNNDYNKSFVVKHDPSGNTFHATAQIYAFIKGLKRILSDVLCVNFNIINEMANNSSAFSIEKEFLTSFPTLYIIDQQQATEDEIVKKISEFNSSLNRKIIFVRAATSTEDSSITGRISFTNLSHDGQSKFLNAKVNFQGFVVTLKDLLKTRIDYEDDNKRVYEMFTLETEIFQKLVENPETLSKFLTNSTSEINIGEPVADVTSFMDDVSLYYINRTFCKNILSIRVESSDDLEIKENEMPADYPGYYLISVEISPSEVADMMKINSNFVDNVTFSSDFIPPERKYVFVTSQCNNDLLRQVQEQKSDFHWFTHADKSFIWQASSLNSVNNSNLPKVVANDDYYKEDDMLDSSNRVIIFGDEAGSGKTTMMFRFAKETKIRFSQSWIIFVSLASVSEQLLQHFRGRVDLANVTEFFACFDSSVSELHVERFLRFSILKTLLKQSDGVTLFLDGFDEIPPNVQSVVIQVAQIIVRETEAKLRISSRFYAQTELEKALRTFAYKMNPLTEVERVDFLCKFWKAQPEFKMRCKKDAGDVFAGYRVEDIKTEGEDVEDIDFAQRILDEIKNTLKDVDVTKLLGIPLLMFMAGTISFKHFLDHITTGASKENTMFTTVLDLYKKFIQSTFDRALEKKFVQGCYLEWHHKVAFHYLSPSFIIDEDFRKMSELIPYVDNTMLAFVSQIGLLQAHEMNIQFIHRSIAEYFTAEFLISNLNRVNETTRNRTLDFLKLNFFIPSFEKIHYFMDLMMAEQIAKVGGTNILMDIMSGKYVVDVYGNFLECLKTNSTNDLLNRVPLCYVIAYRSKSIRRDLWKRICEVNLLDIDSLGQNPLCYWSFRDDNELFRGQSFVPTEESIWKMRLIAALKGSKSFLERSFNQLLPIDPLSAATERKFMLEAIRFASYFKTQQHAECICCVITNSTNNLHDFGAYQCLVDDKYEIYSDFMQYIPVKVEVVMWVFCKNSERKKLLNLFLKKYIIPEASHFDISSFEFLEFPNRKAGTTLNDIKFAHNVLKTQEILKFMPSAISNQECEILMLIQCALMTLCFSEKYIASYDCALHYAFIIRIVALSGGQGTIDKLIVNDKRVPNFEKGKFDVIPTPLFTGVTFEIPFQDGTCSMVISGIIHKRLGYISPPHFFSAFDRGGFDIYTFEGQLWKRLSVETSRYKFANRPRDSSKMSEDFKLSGNFWITDEKSLSIKAFSLEIAMIRRPHTATAKATFEESVAKVLLNSGCFFIFRRDDVIEL